MTIINKKDCGCYDTIKWLGKYTFIQGQYLCEFHNKEKKQNDDIRKQAEWKYIREVATELKCDRCGTNLGYVVENDLNGSKFICNNCKKGY